MRSHQSVGYPGGPAGDVFELVDKIIGLEKLRINDVFARLGIDIGEQDEALAGLISVVEKAKGRGSAFVDPVAADGTPITDVERSSVSGGLFKTNQTAADAEKAIVRQ